MNKEIRSPAVVAPPSVHGSHLGTLIPKPVRFPQLPGKLLYTSTMHFCMPWWASWSVTLTEMRALVLLLFAATALTVQGSCPGCPLEVRCMFGSWLYASSGGKPWLRTGGSGWLGGASTSRLWRKMPEDSTWCQGFFHSGETCFSRKILFQLLQFRLLRAPSTSSPCS